MTEQHAALVTLRNRIVEWEREVADARLNLANYEKSVRHANNIIATSEHVIAELREAIAVLEAK